MTMQIFKVAQTQVDWRQMVAFGEAIGAKDWFNNYGLLDSSVSTIDDHSFLTEVMGRLCYKSFGTGLNANITKTREGNKPYISNLLGQHHGSVLEHSYVTFIMVDVSRIFTHELVRHRAGMAFSQESQRFVRLDNFEVRIPDLTEVLEDLAEYNSVAEPHRAAWAQEKQVEYFNAIMNIKDNTIAELSDVIASIGLDNEGVPFAVKKKITSALRRGIPGGVLTNIGVTGNHRAWRHILEARTAGGAEEEAVEGLNHVGHNLLRNFGHIYQDCELLPHPEYPKLKQFVFTNKKV